jgi:radical SAM protein with 4Fe4S-binding SPASM domain
LIRKYYNLLQIILGYIVSRISRKVVHWGSPVGLSVEPTNSCNLHCPECPSGQRTLTREKGFIDEGLFSEIMSVTGDKLLYLTFYFQGEPYLHTCLTRMIKIAKSNKIFVSTSTNGHFLTSENVNSTLESGLDKLIISLDGTDPETYSTYRIGGSFVKVIESIQEIIRQKKELGLSKPKVILQFLVLKTNEHQISDVKIRGSQLGVNAVEIKTAQFMDFKHGNPLIPGNSRYSRYVASFNQAGEMIYRIRNRMPNHCFRMWSSCVITWDGWVVPCCYDKDAKYKMGNIKDEPFYKIWKSEKYRKFRQQVLHARVAIDICTNCSEGMGISRFL